MVFTGEYEHTIDAKNRLAIPSQIRAQMREEAGDGGRMLVLYVTLGESQSLCLYTELGFNERADELKSSDADADQLLAFEALWFSLARRVELDSAGRLRLPDNLLKRAGLGTQVMLIGVNDHMEIRDRRIWNAYVDQVLAEQQQILMNPRRAVRQAQNRPR